MKMFDLKELSQEINISIRTLSRYIRRLLIQM
jgi:predicted DNA binding protein